MKVAYNNCYGGFGLSPKAMTEYGWKKGFDLVWYKQVKFKHSDGVDLYEKVNPLRVDENTTFVHSTKADHGPATDCINDDSYYYENFSEPAKRCDPDLIEIIERLGEEADGYCAKLEIEEIPDGAAFEITNYDGMESVVPPRQSW